MTALFQSWGLTYEWAWGLATLAGILLITLPLLLAVAMSIYFDRKIWAAMALRRGPNVVGPWGLLQSFADGLSSKESAVGIAAARLAQAAAPVGGVSTPADAIRAAGIATSGADRSAGVNLTVNAGIGTNGAQVGQTIVDALNAWTLRNGALPARWIT